MVSGLEETSLGLLAEPVECQVCTGLCQWLGAFPRATVLQEQEEVRSLAPNAFYESYKNEVKTCFCSSLSVNEQKALTLATWK